MNAWLAPKYIEWLGQGFLVTLELAATAALAATALGFVLAITRQAQRGIGRIFASLTGLYVLAFRNSPLLIQLLFWYFGVATLLPEAAMRWLNTAHTVALGPVLVHWPSFEFIAGWVALTLYSSAFIAEEFRAGIRGVATGQQQAAAALGLSTFDIFRHVTLPQAIKIAMPPLFGQYMNIVKNSSLAMAIGVAELSYASRQVDTETFKTFQAFGAATLLYIATIALLEGVLLGVQRRRRAVIGR